MTVKLPVGILPHCFCCLFVLRIGLPLGSYTMLACNTKYQFSKRFLDTFFKYRLTIRLVNRIKREMLKKCLLYCNRPIRKTNVFFRNIQKNFVSIESVANIHCPLLSLYTQYTLTIINAYTNNFIGNCRELNTRYF